MKEWLQSDAPYFWIVGVQVFVIFFANCLVWWHYFKTKRLLRRR